MGLIGIGISMIKSYIGLVIYSLLMVIYVPFFIFGALLIRRRLWVTKLKKIVKLGYKKEGKLGMVSRRNRVTDVAVVSTENELDFLENRSICYLYRMCFTMPWELVKTVLRQEKIQLLSDQQLAYVIMNSVFSHSVRWDSSRKMFRLYMDGLEGLYLFQGFYWDAREILVSSDGTKIVIIMANGEEYHSDCSEGMRPTYELAKLHAQVCLTFFGPGLSHNHVHFVLPSSMAVLAPKLLNRDGVLYKLLSPHFRFTECINHQALRIQKATNNKRSKLDRLFFFWQPIPITKEQFSEGVARKCKQHYVDKGGKDCEAEDAKSSSRKPSTEYGEAEDTYSSIKHDKSEPRTHYLFPPEFVTDKTLQKIPYLNFLSQYYIVIRNFVKAMVPFIDKDEWKTLSVEVAKHVPRFDKCNMIDAIATFIHQVGVIHFCDHNSFLRYFAFRYGSMAMTIPFEPFENVYDWEEFAQEFNFDPSEVKRNPLMLIRQRDVLRTRSFLEIFVDFIPSTNLDLQLISTEYGFDHKGPKMAVSHFKSQLRALDGNLKVQKEILPFPKNKGEIRAEGMRLVPLDDIVRTVCY